jgi:hypothetical protein
VLKLVRDKTEAKEEGDVLVKFAGRAEGRFGAPQNSGTGIALGIPFVG